MAMTDTWDRSAPGVLALPSGRLVRGRGLRRPDPGGQDPEFGVYLLGKPPPEMPWDFSWIRWPDFGLPSDPEKLRGALEQVRERAVGSRVEVACAGGLGRTGTALACLAVMDGVPAAEAVAYVRDRYDPRAVETRAQSLFVAAF